MSNSNANSSLLGTNKTLTKRFKSKLKLISLNISEICDRYLQLLRKSREVGACICELKVRVRHGKEVMQAIGGVQPLL